MEKVTRIGVDTPKVIFQLHGTSHGVIAPVSMPIRASAPARRLSCDASTCGSLRQVPRHLRCPRSSTTQIAVDF